jgi:ABC-type polysaccharide/polyol phosphate transport system ATPase subunit
MDDVVIRVDNLGKQYRLGQRVWSGNLRETLTNALRAPWRWLRSGRGAGATDDTFWALKDVSFEVRQGELVGIIGRNGAGKSTLLKILSRIVEPTTGEAELNGRVGSLLEVGTGFHPELTGRENVYLNGAILGMSRAEIARKFDEIVTFAEVERFIDTQVKHYSSGMYMRLAFAVAAHLETEVLLIDEVLAVGDAGYQRKCLAKMREITRSGRTILFISHNMAAINSLCGTAYLLAGGRIVRSGDPQTVTEAYHRDSRGSGHPREELDVPPGEVRFVGWHLDARPDSPHALPTGETCRFRFRFVARRRVRDGHFGIAIYARDGSLVWAMRSLDSGRGSIPIEEGCHEAEFDLGPLPVRPDAYHVLVSANDLTDGLLDSWTAQPLLCVLPTRETGLPVEWQGILDLDGRFRLAAVAADDVNPVEPDR